MVTIKNKFGDKQTSWTSHCHPHNPNFTQVVKYMHIQFKDGRNHLYWRLFNSSPNDTHVIPNITLEKAKALYVDKEVVCVSENDFQQWLTIKQKQSCLFQ